MSGHGTTHNTNGIVIQHGNTTASTTDPPNASTTDPPNAFTTDVLEKRTRKRSLEPPLTNLATHYEGKNEDPAPFAAGISLEQSTYAMLLKNTEKLDLAYHVTKFNVDRFLPSWTGYNHLLAQVEVPPRSVTGYLPVIDGNPTDMSTVVTILQKSIQISDKLELEAIVIVMDQAIYSKAQLIRWKYKLMSDALHRMRTYIHIHIHI